MMKIEGLYKARKAGIDDLRVGDLIIIRKPDDHLAGFITEINGYIVVLEVGTEELVEHIAYDDTEYEIVEKGTMVTLIL